MATGRSKPLYIALILMSASSLAAAQAQAATFKTLTCTHMDVKVNHAPLIGIEDMAYDPQTERLYLSAYDRRKVARELKAGQTSLSGGGIFALNPASLEPVPLRGDIQAISVLESVRESGREFGNFSGKISGKARPLENTIRPHGMSLSRHGPALKLSFIERFFNGEGLVPRLLTLIDNGAEGRDDGSQDSWVLSAQGSLPCAANDMIIMRDGTHIISSDHKACTVRGQRRENIFFPKRAYVRFENEAGLSLELGGLSFANGVALSADESLLYVAETRKKRLSVYDMRPLKSGELPTLERYIHLPGGPDNLTLGMDGYVYAALHTHLMRFGLFRAGGAASASSRVARVSPSGEVEIFDMAKNILSGVTVAVPIGSKLWLGAAYDQGLAICDLPPVTAKNQYKRDVP